MTTPALFETILHTGESYADLPKPVNPYFAVANEGIFLCRDTAIGQVYLPQKTNRLGKMGYKDGVFHWDAPKIPASIISQAHDFFKRIYMKHHTEAEVIITYHTEKKEFRLFVPRQRVSHTGVKSIYDQSHIQKGWLVVGTLHSHCDFGAFHSGTDSGDASDMDGVHFTIGQVLHSPPQIVAMVVMNGIEFHYKDPSQIADIEFGTTTSPEWWDQFVYPGQSPTDKPKSFKTISDADWNNFKGLHVGVVRSNSAIIVSPSANKPYTPSNSYQPSTGYRSWDQDTMWDDDWSGFSGMTRESIEFNRRQEANRAKPPQNQKTMPKGTVWRYRKEKGGADIWDMAKGRWYNDPDPEEKDETLIDLALNKMADESLLDDADIALLDEDPTEEGVIQLIVYKMMLLRDIAETLGQDIDIVFNPEIGEDNGDNASDTTGS